MVKKHRSEIFLDRHIWDKITHSGVLRDNLVCLWHWGWQGNISAWIHPLHGHSSSTQGWLRSTEQRVEAFSSSCFVSGTVSSVSMCIPTSRLGEEPLPTPGLSWQNEQD